MESRSQCPWRTTSTWRSLLGHLRPSSDIDRSIDKVVADLLACSQRFTIDDQGGISDFLGIQVQKRNDGSIQLTQSQLIDSIIKDLYLQSGSNAQKTPAVTTNLPHKDSDGPDMTPDFTIAA